MITGFYKKLLKGIILVSLLLCLSVCIDYADTVTINNTDDGSVVAVNSTDDVLLADDDLIVPNPKKDKVYKEKDVVEKTKKKIPLITIVAKPSCSCKNPYRWHKRTFVNYCPYCRKYGVLTNLHKHPARFEQEISCGKCKADFCGVCGKEKYSWSHRYLRKA